MQIFEKQLTVTPSHLDDLNHVNNVQYVQWIQDVAKEHWQILASPALQEKYVWVVLEHHITYKNAAILGDVIQIKTYVSKTEGVTSIREVEMYHIKTRKLIVKATTNWCLLDVATKKPTRIPEEIKTIFHK